ncbi:glycoside hydrolase family 13 protein [Tilletiaria anomala UBC 951]|uniref:Glycoside hydrolase family 13 protein n=1 Tax=Tilletiaria anomala (strain ATCC 24038 / CBS 436.72 / UBC 951) TaxID=1037660 RepID=A0A066W8Z0_TILAU|nr:glycoside hydrolase family 13 protein [Tilletiaria anomala UBC 951]KDN47549.1 glycoside hydrolase family 13 protein [Tilletiaria anomala UBC 951]
MPKTWWEREAIVYQVWPASFADSNNDGFGDIPGIISKLDHINSLGANTLWVSPHYASPRIDEGYDISDYKAVYPPFGTMEDTERLIRECHQRGLKIIFDLVINHTSDQHAWFKASRSSKSNPKRDWYIWRPAKYDDKGNMLPPNNWRSYFNESAWTWDEHTQEYYLHLFCKEQPDLNWTCEDARKQIYQDAIIFWLEKGINGFRVDTVNMYSKPMDFPDAEVTDSDNPYQPAHSLFCNGPEMPKYLREISAIFDKYDAMTVGELPSTPDFKQVLRYIDPNDPQLSMVFSFDHVSLDRGEGQHFYLRSWKLPELKNAIAHMQTFVRNSSPPAIAATYLENHDQPRSISRFCPAAQTPEETKRAGKMLAMFQTAMSGAQFIYQGQEIGMTNFPDTWGPHEYKDVDSLNYYNYVVAHSGDDTSKPGEVLKKINRIARDNARTPVQWSSAQPYAGFMAPSQGGEGKQLHKPWMRINDNYKDGINVEDQVHDPDSVLAFWKQAIAMRQARPALFVHGTYEPLDHENQHTFSFLKRAEDGKGTVAYIVLNFSEKQQTFTLPTELQGRKVELLMGTQQKVHLQEHRLGGYEGRIYVAS